MKKFLTTLCAIGIATITFNTFGQSITNTPQQNFFSTVGQYFTSFNTNSTTFSSNKFDLWMGADYQNAQNFANTLGIEYKLGSLFSLESVTRNEGIFGTLVSETIGVGFSKTLYDTKVTAFIDGGYDFQLSKGFVSPGLRVKKAMTANTFSGIGIEVPFYFSHNNSRNINPVVTIFTGFVF